MGPESLPESGIQQLAADVAANFRFGSILFARTSPISQEALIAEVRLRASWQL